MKISMKSRLLAAILTISMILGSMPFFAITASAAATLFSASVCKAKPSIVSIVSLIVFRIRLMH